MVIQGVIRPPPEIRAVADRTASYVAKNGRAFETRIRSSAKGKTPKFAFLQDNNPFHAYYQDRIKFYEEGGEDSKEETPEAQEEKKKSDDEKAAAAESKNTISKATHSAIDPVAKALLTQRAKISQMKSETKSSGEESKTDEENANQAQHVAIPPPPSPHFIDIVPPSSLTIVQIETIQLVAQFTALDGKGGTFLSALTRREWNNPQFSFCQPRHGHFAYFSALVDAYRHILTSWTAKDSSRADGIKEMAGNSQKCLELAAYRAEYNRHLVDMRRVDEQVEVAQIDWNDFVVVETLDFGKNEQVMTLPPPPPPVDASPAKASKTGADEMEDSDEDEEQIRVVPTYQPKVVSAAASSAPQTVVDPISGKSVRVQDMPEHMRIQLLDPKWAEERKKFQDKQKDSNLVGGDIVASNIARLAQARGTTVSSVCAFVDYKKEIIKSHSILSISLQHSDVLETEEESRKKLHDANRILREQALDPKTKVGPALPGAEPKRPAPPDAAQPEAKRLRVTDVLPPVRNLAPPPPPGFSDFGAPPANAYPFSAAATGSNLQDTSTAPIGDGVLSEADFVASLPRPEVTIQVRVPNDPAQMAWNFYGQVVSFSINAMSTVKSVKQEVSRQHLNNMPVNKIQLKWVTTGSFLKDAMTLAALNIGPTATLELSPKTRGGRK
jgi:splicing factor 3A subunit 1